MPVHLVAFFVAAFVLLVVPGPSVLYVSARGISQGRGAAILSVCGVAVGSLLLVVITAAGLAALVASSVIVLTVVKYLGVAYLIFLGVKTFLNRGSDVETPAQQRPQSAFRVVGQGAIVEMSNPKAALFFVAFLPQFVDPGRGHAWLQLLILGGLYVAMGLVTDTAYAVASGSVAQFLQRRPRLVSKQRFVAGGVYIVLGIVAGLSGSSSRASIVR
jgi:threonine/homoserine/homoserine lactone efflux protein